MLSPLSSSPSIQHSVIIALTQTTLKINKNIFVFNDYISTDKNRKRLNVISYYRHMIFSKYILTAPVHSHTQKKVMGRVFANGPGDLGSVPGHVIPKTFKMVLDTSLLNTQQYKVCMKGEVEQSRERSSAPPTPWCSSYRKGSLQVALHYSR